MQARDRQARSHGRRSLRNIPRRRRPRAHPDRGAEMLRSGYCGRKIRRSGNAPAGFRSRKNAPYGSQPVRSGSDTPDARGLPHGARRRGTSRRRLHVPPRSHCDRRQFGVVERSRPAHPRQRRYDDAPRRQPFPALQRPVRGGFADRPHPGAHAGLAPTRRTVRDGHSPGTYPTAAAYGSTVRATTT